MGYLKARLLKVHMLRGPPGAVQELRARTAPVDASCQLPAYWVCLCHLNLGSLLVMQEFRSIYRNAV